MKIDVTRVEPAFDGLPFADVGAYEKVVGRARGVIDPANPRNAGIVNLEHLPVDASGLIGHDCDFYLLRPVDPARGNGALFYDVLNRGNKVALHAFNDAPRDGGNPAAMSVNDPSSAADAGNGFLMRQGFSILWSGWQGAGVMGGEGLMSARLPVAPVTGLSREEFVFEHAQNPVTAPLSYPAMAQDQRECTLTVRQRARDERTVIGPACWRFVSGSAIEIDRPDGFDASAIYEFIYHARDPIVMGMGFAAVRDIVSAVRRGGLIGTPALDRALAFGMSQAGRFLRDFVHLGFNEDLEGRKVFDGIFPSMAGSRKTFVNYPFAQPGRFARQHEDRLFPHDQFPFSYAVTTDPVSGRSDGIFARCSLSQTCPKVIQTESSSDFFHGRASLLVTDGAGEDIPVPDSVRLYHFAGVQHGGGHATANFARNFPFTQHSLNPADFSETHRALLVGLDRWVSDGKPPPDSRFPNASDGTLVSADVESYGFPSIPDAAYRGLFNELAELDYSTQPPRPLSGRDYAVSVPAIDSDGNEIPGIRVPEVAVPLGTYAGWAPRKAGYAEGELMALGSFLPFARTREERLASGDTRLSIEERYPTDEDYILQIAETAAALFDDGLLLAEDIGRIVEAARSRMEAANSDA